MNQPSEEVLDQVIGHSGRREPFDLLSLKSPALEAFLSPEKLAALKYARVWIGEKHTLGYHPLEAPNPWPLASFSPYLAKVTAEVGTSGAPLLRQKFPKILQVGSRVVARMPDGEPIILEWAKVSDQSHLMFKGAWVGALRAKGRSIPVREQLAMYNRAPTERPGADEFDCSSLADVKDDLPPLALLTPTKPEWNGWFGVRFNANQYWAAPSNSPAESVFESFYAELLVKADLSGAVFSGSYDMDASQ